MGHCAKTFLAIGSISCYKELQIQAEPGWKRQLERDWFEEWSVFLFRSVYLESNYWKQKWEMFVFHCCIMIYNNNNYYIILSLSPQAPVALTGSVDDPCLPIHFQPRQKLLVMMRQCLSMRTSAWLWSMGCPPQLAGAWALTVLPCS